MRCSSFFSMNSMYGKDNSSILLNTSKNLKLCNFQFQGSRRCQTTKKMFPKTKIHMQNQLFFPNLYKNKFLRNAKKSLFDNVCKDICKLFCFLTFKRNERDLCLTQRKTRKKINQSKCTQNDEN